MFFKKLVSTLEKGFKGENLARKYLEKEGYKILKSNYKFGKFEIDIIAVKEKIISFIEVKMEKEEDFPADLKVNYKKRKNIISAAKAFLHENSIDASYCFDIIRVIKNGNSYEIKHIENAFDVNGNKNIF